MARTPNADDQVVIEIPELAAPSNVPPAETNQLLEAALPSMLQLCLSGALKSLGTAAESEPRKLASKLYTLAGFINFTLVFALAVHRLALLTGAMKPSNSRMVKSIMWVTLAVSYFTFIIGTVLNLLA